MSISKTHAKPDSRKRSTRMVGILFLTAMAASLVGGSIIEDILSSANGLATLSENKIQILIGVLLELINGISVVGIGVLMFPIFKKYNENIARGYLSFRIIEAVFYCSIVITPLSLIQLSVEHTKAGALPAEYFQGSGALLLAVRSSIVDFLIPVFFSIGALLFYFLLYKAKLLPRFISVWGTIGAILILAMNLLTLFQGDSLSTGLLIVFALPIILNEIFLGIWLIVKGFNQNITAY